MARGRLGGRFEATAEEFRWFDWLNWFKGAQGVRCKAAALEQWNGGRMGKKLRKDFNPLFHYSIAP
jgi:hypothetical protein